MHQSLDVATETLLVLLLPIRLNRGDFVLDHVRGRRMRSMARELSVTPSNYLKQTYVQTLSDISFSLSCVPVSSGFAAKSAVSCCSHV